MIGQFISIYVMFGQVMSGYVGIFRLGLVISG
jgi:hypothetical protein